MVEAAQARLVLPPTATARTSPALTNNHLQAARSDTDFITFMVSSSFQNSLLQVDFRLPQFTIRTARTITVIAHHQVCGLGRTLCPAAWPASATPCAPPASQWSNSGGRKTSGQHNLRRCWSPLSLAVSDSDCLAGTTCRIRNRATPLRNPTGFCTLDSGFSAVTTVFRNRAWNDWRWAVPSDLQSASSNRASPAVALPKRALPKWPPPPPHTLQFRRID